MALHLEQPRHPSSHGGLPCVPWSASGTGSLSSQLQPFSCDVLLARATLCIVCLRKWPPFASFLGSYLSTHVLAYLQSSPLLAETNSYRFPCKCQVDRSMQRGPPQLLKVKIKVSLSNSTVFSNRNFQNKNSECIDQNGKTKLFARRTDLQVSENGCLFILLAMAGSKTCASFLSPTLSIALHKRIS